MTTAELGDVAGRLEGLIRALEHDLEALRSMLAAVRDVRSVVEQLDGRLEPLRTRLEYLERHKGEAIGQFNAIEAKLAELDVHDELADLRGRLEDLERGRG